MLPGNVPLGGIINGRYRVNAWLGGGANGQVYEVIDHRQNNRVCALKLMFSIPSAGPWHEAAVLTGLDGEFVLPILNADDANGVPFIVTEVMGNGSLEQRIPLDLGVDVDQACRWIRHACRGLARIHDRSLLHNDIKPENLFLDGDDEVLVGDLGLACFMDANGKGHYAGTPTTMAPEVAAVALAAPAQVALHRPTSVASDVYSLGATLYWLLAGHPIYPPTPGIPIQQYLTLITSTAPAHIRDVAPHVPQGLGTIVMKAIERNPADRYASPAALDAAIGGRTKYPRLWTRTVPCAGHTTCFQGTRPQHVTLKVCAVPTGHRTQHVIEVHRHPSGHRVNPWPTVANANNLPQALRAKFRTLP